jgi:hypothetical protein
VTRVRVVVEGPTEESFIKDVLAEILWPNQIFLIPIIVGVPGHKGGRTNYERVKKDVGLHLKQEQTAYCSTMLDLCGLGEGFPGFPVPPNLSNLVKDNAMPSVTCPDGCARQHVFRVLFFAGHYHRPATAQSFARQKFVERQKNAAIQIPFHLCHEDSRRFGQSLLTG